MLAISQKPERVSNILRSSTETTRLNGIGAAPAGGGRRVDRRVPVGVGAHAATPSRARAGWRR